MVQLTLFDSPQTPTRARTLHVSRATRREAKTKHEPHMCAQSQAVLAAIRESGGAGMTRHEVAAALGIPVSSVCGRVKPMLGGSLYQDGTRRDGRAVLKAKGF